MTPTYQLGGRSPRVWTDCYGNEHLERVANVPDHDGAVPRVQGALEVRWARAGASERAAITAALLAQQNPIVAGAGAGTDPVRSHADSLRDYTWVVEAPEASAVLLWANGLFNHHDPSPNEMTHLEGSDLWTLTWRLPASWRASYRISIWSPPQSGGDTPPWRASGDRFAARRAAMAGELDARCKKRIGGANGESSLAEGPLAALGHLAAPELPSSSKIRELTYPASDRWLGQRVWLYCPDSVPAGPTPLLLLFDGQTWLNNMDLPATLDSMILSGQLPPLHVAMIDSRDTDSRWEQLGVPAGQAEFVARHLVTDLRERLPSISKLPADTVVSGQSLGGIGALWAAALAEGRIGRVIAQSPSLWRFDVSEPLLASSALDIVLQAGHFEGQMLSGAESLAKTLQAHSGSHIRVDDVWGGHDWAWWRASLIETLGEMLASNS